MPSSTRKILVTVHGYDGVESNAPAFIQSPLYDMEINVGAYIVGHEPAAASIGAFVNTPLYASSSVLDAYVVAPPFSELYSQLGALQFDRSKSQYAQIPHNVVYNGLTSFTLNAWVMPLSPPPGGSNYPVFLEKEYGSNQSIGLFQNPTTGAFHGGINTGSWTATNSTTIPTQGKWYMITMVYTGSEFIFYVNGVEESRFGKTGTVVMNADPWNIAYRPNTGQYLSMAVSDFKLWNYAIDPNQISNDLYIPPNDCVSRPSYIVVSEPHPTETTKEAYISSERSSENPLISSSSVGAVISPALVRASQGAFIGAGEYQSDMFDMITYVESRSSINFDSVIYVRGGITYYSDFKTGVVEYPITREAKRPINIYTRDVPGESWNATHCHIVKSHEVQSSQLAHITTGAPSSSSQMAFVNTDTNRLNETLLAFISGGVEGSQHLFISGVYAPASESEQFAFIVAREALTVSSTREGFVNAAPRVITGTQAMFINTAEYSLDAQMGYICAQDVFSIVSAMYTYMFASGVKRNGHQCFIEGVFWNYSSVNAYIPVIPLLRVSIGAYIAASTPHKVFHNLSIHGNQPVATYQSCLIKADLFVRSEKAGFVAGVGQRISSRGAFIQGILGNTDFSKAALVSGHQAVEMSAPAFIYNQESSGSVEAYISGENIGLTDQGIYISGENVATVSLGAFITNHATLNGFIVNNPWDTQRCFIISVGGRRKHIAAYIDGVPLREY